MTALPPKESQDAQKQRAARRRLILIGLALGAVSLFMYVSFIFKTAVRGP